MPSTLRRLELEILGRKNVDDDLFQRFPAPEAKGNLARLQRRAYRSTSSPSWQQSRTLSIQLNFVDNVWNKPVAWVEQSLNGRVFRIASSPVTCSIGFVLSFIINIHIFIDNKQINYIISFFQSTSIVKGINILVSIGAGLLARPETNWNPVIQEIFFLFLAVGRDRQEIPV